MRPTQTATFDSGRMGFREVGEPYDARPLIARTDFHRLCVRDASGCVVDSETWKPSKGFWTDESERLTHEHAVETHPRRNEETPLRYIIRIAEIVSGRMAAMKPMPQAHLGKHAVEERIRLLDEQAEPMRDAD